MSLEYEPASEPLHDSVPLHPPRANRTNIRLEQPLTVAAAHVCLTLVCVQSTMAQACPRLGVGVSGACLTRWRCEGQARMASATHVSTTCVRVPNTCMGVPNTGIGVSTTPDSSRSNRTSQFLEFTGELTPKVARESLIGTTYREIDLRLLLEGWGVGHAGGGVRGRRELISQKVVIKSFCKSQLPPKSVNVSFIFTNVNNKSTNFCGN